MEGTIAYCKIAIMDFPMPLAVRIRNKDNIEFKVGGSCGDPEPTTKNLAFLVDNPTAIYLPEKSYRLKKNECFTKPYLYLAF